MKLQAAKITRDENGVIVSENVPDEQAIVDLKQRTADFVETNSVDIVAVLYEKSAGRIAIHFALGAYDSAGTFHVNEKYNAVAANWGRESTPDIWQKYNLDSLTVLDFEKIKEWLYEQNAVIFAGLQKWKIPRLEARLCDDSGTEVKPYKER